MNTEEIGLNAGLIWNALNDGSKLTVKALKKMTKVKDRETYLALGWLAREGKIYFEELDNELLVCLQF